MRQQPILMAIASSPSLAPILQELITISLVLECSRMLEHAAGLAVIGEPDVSVLVNGNRAAKDFTGGFPYRLAG